MNAAMTGGFEPRHQLVVRRYTASDAEQWTTFVRASRTGLFLFERPYMDYHADRFVDHSLLLLSGDELVAVFPASEASGAITSHAGLTFGGLVCGANARQTLVAEAWRAIVDYYGGIGFSSLQVKQVPWAFRRPLCDDETWALWMVGATTSRVDVNAVIDRSAAPAMQERRLRSVKKAAKHGVTVSEEADFSTYWNEVLIPVLWDQHQQRPVHTLGEISLLKASFPTRIRLFVARLNGWQVAGTVLYDFGEVLHTQYLAASEPARKVGALDLLVHTLVTTPPTSPRFISFGIANQEQGRVLNAGLLDWKEGFGARAVPHVFWTVPLKGMC